MNLFFGWLQSLWKKICEIIKLFFGEDVKPSPPRQVNTEIVPNKIIGGYFWTGGTKVVKPTEELNSGLLTHIYYAFLELAEDGTLFLQNEKRSIRLKLPDDLSQYKRQNPHLKILFSVVGKKDSFSIVVADETKRKLFVESALIMIIKWEYDGLDLDWEFPKDKDKENFVKLLSDLSAEFKKHNFLLTAAVRAIPVYEGSGYDVPKMVKYLDIINIMTYDFYGAWSSHTGPNAPLYPSSTDSPYERKYLNVKASLKNWIEAGAPKEKICLGIPFYGRSFTLKDRNEHGLHAPVSGGGHPIASTYYQIMVRYRDWHTVWNDEQKTPYKYYGDQWIGYDNHKSIIEKVKFALEQDVAGVFVWQLGGDDMTGAVSGGIPQFLLTTIYQQIVGAQPFQLILTRASESEEDQVTRQPHKEQSQDDFLELGFDPPSEQSDDSELHEAA